MATTTQNDSRHILYWKRGEYGRGLYYEETDTVVTWPENEMTHTERHQALQSIENPCVGSGKWPTEFLIGEDGTLYQYYLNKQQTERVLELLPSLKEPRYWKKLPS